MREREGGGDGEGRREREEGKVETKRGDNLLELTYVSVLTNTKNDPRVIHEIFKT